MPEPAKNTVEQIAVEPSMHNIARTTAKGRRNLLLPKRFPTRFRRPKLIVSIRRARVIQIRQNLDAQRNLPAFVQAASSLGKSIQERLTKNSVASCATTLYVPPQLVSRGTTTRMATWVRSHLATVCRSSSPGPDRVDSLGLLSPSPYAVEHSRPAKSSSSGRLVPKT